MRRSPSCWRPRRRRACRGAAPGLAVGNATVVLQVLLPLAAQLAAALWKTPGCGLGRLHYRTYPDGHVGAGSYAEFLEELLERRLPRGPVVVVHDGGTTHRGEPVEELADDFDRLLGLHPLPPYAPMLNPVEQLWDWLKYDELPDFAPEDVPHLDAAINARLFGLHRDQPRLRTRLASTPLRW